MLKIIISLIIIKNKNYCKFFNQNDIIIFFLTVLNGQIKCDKNFSIQRRQRKTPLAVLFQVLNTFASILALKHLISSHSTAKVYPIEIFYVFPPLLPLLDLSSHSPAQFCFRSSTSHHIPATASPTGIPSPGIFHYDYLYDQFSLLLLFL